MNDISEDDGGVEDDACDEVVLLKIEEYKTLRSELLQRYGEQSRLAFASTLVAAAFFLGIIVNDISVTRKVIATFLFQSVLIIIAYRLRWNYSHLFRIGTYIRYVHEIPNKWADSSIIRRIWWIDASRTIMMHRRNRAAQWGRHAVSEAWLIAFLGVGGPLSFVILGAENSEASVRFLMSAKELSPALMATFLVVLSTAALIYATYSLAREAQNPEEFKEELNDFIDRETK